MELLVLPDAQAVAAAAASRLLEEARQYPRRPLGLATGRTMEPVYDELVRLVAQLSPAQGQVVRQGWLSFNLDEYVGLGAGDPRSFAAFMAARLGQPLELRPEQLQLPDGLAADPEREASRYGAALAAAGGVGLQLLGLGLNGHVGFNEPPSTATVGCRCLSLSATTRAQNAAAFGGDPEAVPARAITLGLQEILAAERIMLVVTGTAKAAILRRALLEPPCPDVPASWLQGHPKLEVAVDTTAAALLTAS